MRNVDYKNAIIVHNNRLKGRKVFFNAFLMLILVYSNIQRVAVNIRLNWPYAQETEFLATCFVF